MWKVRRGKCNYTGRSGFFLTAYSQKIDPAIDAILDRLADLLPGRVTWQEGGSGWEMRRGPSGAVDPSLGLKIVVHLAD